MTGFVRLLAVDIPAKKNQDDSCSGSTMYDKVDNESTDGYSKLSDYDQSKRPSLQHSSSSSNSEPSTKDEQQQQQESNSHAPDIATRPPMNIPDSDSDSDDNLTGAKLMAKIEQQVKQSGEKINTAMRTKPIVHSISQAPLDEASEESDSNTNAIKMNRRDSGIVPNSTSAYVIRKTNERIKRAEQSSSNGFKKSRSMPDLTNGSSSSEEDYDYTSLDGPKKLNRPRKGFPRNPSIPSECFKNLRKRVALPEGSDPLGIGDKFELRTYLSSQGFFDHFTDSFFEWAEKLSQNNLQEAATYKSGICCPEIRTTPPPAHRVTLEFIPALPVYEWPSIASEWQFRKRKSIRDPRTNIAYTWPHPDKVEAVTKLGCHLLTDGGKVGGRFSLQKNFQWQLAFGNAEESLLSTLSHSHLRCFIWAQLIFCHVLEPIGVLSTHHVTTLFLWLVEGNYVGFEEASLGERIAHLFRKLYFHLKKRKLSHYFIRSRNLLDSKRSEDILKGQEKVYRLLEKFIPLTIQAALQIESTNSAFPFPNLNELWDILTCKSTLASINPSLKEIQLSAVASDYDEPKKVKRKPASNDRTQQLLRKERARRQAEQREKTEVPKSKEVVEAEKFDVAIGAMDPIRTKLLLTFFVKQFIAMARAANQNRAYEMSIVLLSQAANLSALLQDAGYYDEAQQYLETIENLRHVAYPSQLNEAVVNIPGSPYVFKTGARTRTTSESNHWESRPRPELPLPQEPVFKSHKISNGHVPRSHEEPPTDSAISSFNKSGKKLEGTLLKPSKNPIKKFTVSAMIENDRYSSTGSDSDNGNPLELPRTPSRAFLSNPDTEDESTDF